MFTSYTSPVSTDEAFSMLATREETSWLPRNTTHLSQSGLCPTLHHLAPAGDAPSACGLWSTAQGVGVYAAEVQNIGLTLLLLPVPHKHAPMSAALALCVQPLRAPQPNSTRRAGPPACGPQCLPGAKAAAGCSVHPNNNSKLTMKTTWLAKPSCYTSHNLLNPSL